MSPAWIGTPGHLGPEYLDGVGIPLHGQELAITRPSSNPASYRRTPGNVETTIGASRLAWRRVRALGPPGEISVAVLANRHGT